MATPLQASQSGNINKLEITSKSGDTVDVSAGVVVCDYYESILDSSVRFSIVIVDTGNSSDGKKNNIAILQDLKLTGSEKVNITLEDNLGNKLKFGGDNDLYILEIRNIISSAENTIFTLDLVSRELIANDLLACEVYRRFDGEISQSVALILNEYLKTKKNINLDATANVHNFAGKGKKPFTLLAEIATKAVSQSSENSAGYLIYETYEGFNFRSIDTLFDDGEENYKSFIYNSTAELPTGYDGKIISFDASKTVNVRQNLAAGTYGSKLETFDTYTHIFNTKSQEVSSDEQKVHGGSEVAKLNEEFESEFATDGQLASRRFTRTDSKGEFPEGNVKEQIEKQRDSNLILEEVILQSAMTYNKLFSLSLEIVVVGDYSLRAGQLVHCDFPEQSSKDQTSVDKELSGLYIICDICTHLTPKTTLTKMHLIRDSYGRVPKKNNTSNSSSGLQSNWANLIGSSGDFNIKDFTGQSGRY